MKINLFRTRLTEWNTMDWEDYKVFIQERNDWRFIDTVAKQNIKNIYAKIKRGLTPLISFLNGGRK